MEFLILEEDCSYGSFQVLDLLILRLLDNPQILQKFFDPLISIVGPLYKYHRKRNCWILSPVCISSCFLFSASRHVFVYDVSIFREEAARNDDLSPEAPFTYSQ